MVYGVCLLLWLIVGFIFTQAVLAFNAREKVLAFASHHPLCAILCVLIILPAGLLSAAIRFVTRRR